MCSLNSEVQILAYLEAENLLEPVSRKYWVHPFTKNREASGRFMTFYSNIWRYPKTFFEYYRISVGSFDELLETLRNNQAKYTYTKCYFCRRTINNNFEVSCGKPC